MMRGLFAMVLAVTIVTSPISAQQIEFGDVGLELGGRVQVQTFTSSVEGAAEDVFLRRARLKLNIRIGEAIEGRLQPEFAGAGTTLRDAYVRFNVTDDFAVSMGQFKRVFTNLELVSSTDLPIIERDGRIAGLADCPAVGGPCSLNRLTSKLGFDGRDVGLRVQAALGGGVGFQATVTNGEGANTSDVNDAKSVSGRLSLTRGDVTVGAFGAVHDHLESLPDGTGDTDYAPAGGVDLEIGDWRDGFHLLGTAVVGDNWRVGPEATFWSAHALVSYYAPLEAERLAGIEPLLRLGWADPDTGTADDGGFLVTPGLMLYVHGKNGISANVDVYAPEGDADTEWSFKLQTYLYF